MNRRRLAEYLRTGDADLLEYNYLSPGAVGGNLPSMMTTRSERMRAAWDDLMVKFHALWLDILDANEKSYEEAKNTLDELKHAQPESCRASLPKFRLLVRVLTKWTYVDKFAEDKDMRLYTARMKELVEELRYICDEYDPQGVKVPEAPVRSREDWTNDQRKAKDAQADIEYVASSGTEPKIPEVPKARSFTDDSRPGKDQAGENKKSASKPKAKKAATKGKGKTPNGKKEAPSGKKAPKSGSDKAKSSRTGAKKVKESVEAHLPPACDSFAMASLARAASGIVESNGSELDSEFLDAGDAIRLCLEAYTDVSSAHVELGETVPSQFPRIDVFLEWEVTRGEETRPSDCYGYARLWFNESEGLSVLDSSDRVRDIIRFDEDVDDEGVARRIYEACDQIYDVSPRRIHSESRVAPALYRLIESVNRGMNCPDTAIPQILSALRARVGMHENVRMVPGEIRLALNEDFSDIWNYHYTWGARTPLGHRPLPDEIGPDKGTMDDPPPEDEEAEAEKERSEPYIASARVSSEDDDGPGDTEWQLHKFGESTSSCSYCGYHLSSKDKYCPDCGEKNRKYQEARKTGAYVEHWQTGTVRVNFRKGVVTIADSKGNEYKVAKDAKDEDIAAKLATFAYQKESVETGHLIEGDVQLNRKDFGRVVETAAGGLIEAGLYERSSLEVGPLRGGKAEVKWRGKRLGFVGRRRGSSWGYAERQTGPWQWGSFNGAFQAGEALAKSMGLHESKVSPAALKRMETSELMNHAVVRGLKVPGDGVTWDRDKLIRELAADMRSRPEVT